MPLCIQIRVPKFLRRSKEPEWVTGIFDRSMVSPTQHSAFPSINESVIYPTPMDPSLGRMSYHATRHSDHIEQRGTVHLLSRKSRWLERDTFIFWATPDCRLLLGLNQKRTPVTMMALYRWIRLIDTEIDDFHVQPVVLEKTGILNYVATPLVGPAQHPFSLLPPGDYCLVDPATAEFEACPPWGLRPCFPFEREKRNAEKRPTWDTMHELNTFPPLFEQSVGSRDGWRCFVTGEEAALPEKELALTWLFPPAWEYRLLCENGQICPSVEDFISISNVGLIRKDLMSLFQDNAFGVDVDDDYRVVAFRDLGPAIKLTQHQPRVCPRPGGRFLREHFRWCLILHLLGGDVREDYTVDDVATLARELGLLEETDGEVARLDDERWQSVLGRELFEHHLSYKFAL